MTDHPPTVSQEAQMKVAPLTLTGPTYPIIKCPDCGGTGGSLDETCSTCLATGRMVSIAAIQLRTPAAPAEFNGTLWEEVDTPTSGEAGETVEQAARSALAGVELARTEVVHPANGARPYSYVSFAGARIEFQQENAEVRYHNGSPVYDAATDKAAAQAQKINDLLFSVAVNAAIRLSNDTEAMEYAFPVGTKVTKPKGYPFPGTVVAAFDNLAGEPRYVVESEHAPGMLHIFSASQIARIDRELAGKGGV